MIVVHETAKGFIPSNIGKIDTHYIILRYVTGSPHRHKGAPVRTLPKEETVVSMQREMMMISITKNGHIYRGV